MSRKLVIVESPAKAGIISGYLGEGYVVESSIGHIRDIPAKAADAPKSLQDEWRRTQYGVDVGSLCPAYVADTIDQSATKHAKLVERQFKLAMAPFPTLVVTRVEPPQFDFPSSPPNWSDEPIGKIEISGRRRIVLRSRQTHR